MLKTSETTEKLLKFIDASPSCFHAVKNICVMLEDAGCIRLLENETWTLEKGKRYFTTRNGSSVLAFSVPENYNGMQIVSAHSDSPTFRVKSGAAKSTDSLRFISDTSFWKLLYIWQAEPDRNQVLLAA